MKHLKLSKAMLAIALLFTVACEDVPLQDELLIEGELPQDFDQFKLKYYTGYTLAEDALKGHVNVNVLDLTVSFLMVEAGGTSQEIACDGVFSISSTDLDELQDLAGEVTVYIQDPETAVGMTDLAYLGVEIDDEDYEIRDALMNEEGKFISPFSHDTCLLRLKLKEWVEASGLADNCSEAVEATLFPEACEFEVQGPQ